METYLYKGTLILVNFEIWMAQKTRKKGIIIKSFFPIKQELYLFKFILYIFIYSSNYRIRKRRFRFALTSRKTGKMRNHFLPGPSSYQKKNWIYLKGGRGEVLLYIYKWRKCGGSKLDSLIYP